MLRFFNKTRKSLLDEGKAGRYIKYAIGEIFLLVVGILIALQINNWNEERKEKELAQQYISSLISDLKEQVVLIEEQLKKESEFLDSSKQILESFSKDDRLIMDQNFFLNATELTTRRTFTVSDSAFSDLVSTGNIKSIKDISIRKKITNYYKFIQRIATIMHANNTQIVDQNYIQIYLKNGYFSLQAFNEVVLPKGFTMDLDVFNPSERLQSIAIKNLSEKDEVTLMNAVSQRYMIAYLHSRFMENSMQETKKLIASLESKI